MEYYCWNIVVPIMFPFCRGRMYLKTFKYRNDCGRKKKIQNINLPAKFQEILLRMLINA